MYRQLLRWAQRLSHCVSRYLFSGAAAGAGAALAAAAAASTAAAALDEPALACGSAW